MPRTSDITATTIARVSTPRAMSLGRTSGLSDAIAASVSLGQRVAHNFRSNALHLDVHLQSGNPILGTGGT